MSYMWETEQVSLLSKHLVQCNVARKIHVILDIFPHPTPVTWKPTLVMPITQALIRVEGL